MAKKKHYPVHVGPEADGFVWSIWSRNGQRIARSDRVYGKRSHARSAARAVVKMLNSCIPTAGPTKGKLAAETQILDVLTEE